MNELVRRRKRLTELEVQCYMMQILNACKNLHSHRIIHRDLKLGNLFLSEKMEIKVGDFGLATKLEYEGERKRTICGTPNYIAPEILEGKNGHSYEVDTWSIGVICYTLLIGKPPFETSDVKTTYRRIRMNAYSFPEHVQISTAARALITKTLNSDPAKRPSLDEILNHEFFNNGGSIPKLLPISTLACPPSSSYTKQFLPQRESISRDLSAGRVSPQRLESTAPVNGAKALFKERKDFINTDRVLPTKTDNASNSVNNLVLLKSNSNNFNENTSSNSNIGNGKSSLNMKLLASSNNAGFDCLTTGRENLDNPVSCNNFDNIMSSRHLNLNLGNGTSTSASSKGGASNACYLLN